MESTHNIDIGLDELRKKLMGKKLFQIIPQETGVKIGDIIIYNEILEDGEGKLDHRFKAAYLSSDKIQHGYIAIGEEYISSVGIINGEYFFNSIT